MNHGEDERDFIYCIRPDLNTFMTVHACRWYIPARLDGPSPEQSPEEGAENRSMDGSRKTEWQLGERVGDNEFAGANGD